MTLLALATVFALNDHHIRRFSRSSSADWSPLTQNIYSRFTIVCKKTINEVRDAWHSQIVESHWPWLLHADGYFLKGLDLNHYALPTMDSTFLRSSHSAGPRDILSLRSIPRQYLCTTPVGHQALPSWLEAPNSGTSRSTRSTCSQMLFMSSGPSFTNRRIEGLSR